MVRDPGRRSARLIWFEDARESARTRLMLKTFSDHDSGDRGPAIRLATADPVPCAKAAVPEHATFATEPPAAAGGDHPRHHRGHPLRLDDRR
jgi:hypothetical protein